MRSRTALLAKREIKIKKARTSPHTHALLQPLESRIVYLLLAYLNTTRDGIQCIHYSNITAKTVIKINVRTYTVYDL